MTKCGFRKEYSEIRNDARNNGVEGVNFDLYHPVVVEAFLQRHTPQGRDPIQFSRRKPGEQWTVSRISGKSLH